MSRTPVIPPTLSLAEIRRDEALLQHIMDIRTFDPDGSLAIDDPRLAELRDHPRKVNLLLRQIGVALLTHLEAVAPKKGRHETVHPARP